MEEERERESLRTTLCEYVPISLQGKLRVNMNYRESQEEAEEKGGV